MSRFDFVKQDAAHLDRAQDAALYRVGQDGLPEKVFDGPGRPSGPVVLDVTGHAADVTVYVGAKTLYPTVRIYTRSTKADVIQAVKNTRIEFSGRVVTVEVPDRGTGTTVIRGGGGTVITSGNARYVSVGGNTTVIGGANSVDDVIQVEANLPENSEIQSNLQSGDLAVFGVLMKLEADSTSGDVTVRGAVANVRTRTSSGDVEIGRITNGAEVTTSSGDIWVGQHEGETIALSSSSGDVSLALGAPATGSVRLSTSSGDITLKDVRGRGVSEGGNLYIETHTSSGDVRRS